MIKFSELNNILTGTPVQNPKDQEITALSIDSRKPTPAGSLFIAIDGIKHDGHQYISQLYSRGVRNYIIEKEIEFSQFPEASFFMVKSSLHAIQSLGSYKRNKTSANIVGIAGSNGKTIVKEWLHGALSTLMRTVKSPASYNSQIGVPLSLWNLKPETEIGIIETGISKTGEMAKLEKIVKPDIGIITNIGSAHDQGFENRKQKLQEKLLLFSDSEVVIYCADHREISEEINKQKTLSWGWDENADIKILEQKKIERKSEVRIKYDDQEFEIILPFIDNASIENALHVFTCLIYLKVDIEYIKSHLSQLKNINMRLEKREGNYGNIIIDDTYNNDLVGLQIGLEYLAKEAGNKKRVAIVSDMEQTGRPMTDVYREIGQLLSQYNVEQVLAVGKESLILNKYFKGECEYFPDTQFLLNEIEKFDFRNSAILVKGARKFKFEEIVKSLERQVTGTILEINVNAVISNYNYYRSLTKSDVKFMAMIKAHAYGSGSYELASALEYHGVEYFGVAYADEGVYLRKKGINAPIMVMNPDRQSFGTYRDYDLEPELYTKGLLEDYIKFLEGQEAKIHLKIESGMNRLGFNKEELEAIIPILHEASNLKIISIYSHLVGADSEEHDEFTHKQASEFYKLGYLLERQLGVTPTMHLLNSTGISRFPQYNFDMVRVGIGLYGISSDEETKKHLSPAHKLVTTISQIKTLTEGDSVGYDRVGVIKGVKKIATIAIGYADGFRRDLSDGKGCVYIHGKRAPVVGNVCMDMTMVDVSNIEDVKEGDEAIVFDNNHPVTEMAKAGGTIPYEILTNLSERIKKVYVYD